MTGKEFYLRWRTGFLLEGRDDNLNKAGMKKRKT
jgi:hypothetical protein